MPFYSYEYFCGANVVLEIEGMPLLEAVGLEVNTMESKRPIYGYSSRFFDGVARGQVIVQGTFIVNYVHQDYVFRSIEQGLIDNGLALEASSTAPSVTPSDQLADQIDSLQANSRVATELITGSEYRRNVQLMQAFKDKYWSPPAVGGSGSNVSFLPNPHDSFGGLDLKVTFGRRNEATMYNGDTGFLISDVYITGRGMPIRISSDTIVEEYPFFGRNLVPVRQNYSVRTVAESVDPYTQELTGEVQTVVGPTNQELQDNISIPRDFLEPQV